MALAASSVTLASSLSTGSFAYESNSATQVVFTLPTSSTIGAVYSITGFGSGGWEIAQNSGDQILGTSGSTTTGTSGSIISTNRYNSISLRCVGANIGSGGIYVIQSISGSPTFN